VNFTRVKSLAMPIQIVITVRFLGDPIRAAGFGSPERWQFGMLIDHEFVGH
jgi:hypothetical protein